MTWGLGTSQCGTARTGRLLIFLGRCAACHSLSGFCLCTCARRHSRGGFASTRSPTVAPPRSCFFDGFAPPSWPELLTTPALYPGAEDEEPQLGTIRGWQHPASRAVDEFCFRSIRRALDPTAARLVRLAGRPLRYANLHGQAYFPRTVIGTFALPSVAVAAPPGASAAHCRALSLQTSLASLHAPTPACCVPELPY